MPYIARALARFAPVLFFQTDQPSVLMDEAQKAPELFEQIKAICEESDETELIWLTGSQQYRMMEQVPEKRIPSPFEKHLCGGAFCLPKTGNR